MGVVSLPIVAFVLIKVSVGKVDSVIQGVRGIRGVKETYTVAGEYDVIAKVEVGELRELKDLVAGNIHRIEGVERTLTLIAVE